MDVEDSKYFGLCKCCLRDGCFRSLWVDYIVDGVLRNYGEMINECFALNWEKPGNDLLDQICDRCTQRTRDAYSFRRQVLASHHQLNNLKHEENEPEVIGDVIYEDEEILEEYIPIIKKEDSYIDNDQYETKKITVEYPGDTAEYLNEPNDYSNDSTVYPNDPNDYPNDHNDPMDYADDPNDPDYQVDPQDAQESDNPDYVDDADGSQDGFKEEYEEVEYLEFEVEAPESVAAPAPPAPPQVKKKRRGGRRVYKNYTIEDLQQSVEAARSGRMSAAEAALRYNVPRKTIAAKILSEKRGGAGRSRRYREKLKREHPEKAEAQRLRNLQRIKSKKKKISEMTPEEAEQRRKAWREEKRSSRRKQQSSQRIIKRIIKNDTNDFIKRKNRK